MMTNESFANALALAVEKKKMNKSKLVEEFICVWNGTSTGEIDIDGDPTPEVVTLVKALPHNYKCNEPHIKEVFAKASEMSAASKQSVSTRTSGFRAQEW